MGVGVPLIPDGAVVRSTTTRRPIRAIGTHSLPLVVAAAIGIVALVVGVVTGTVPAAGAIGVAMLIPAAVIDVEQRRLPDAWVAAAMVGLVATIAIGAAVFLVPRDSLLADAPDRSRWRDIRLWASALIVLQLLIYSIFV